MQSYLSKSRRGGEEKLWGRHRWEEHSLQTHFPVSEFFEEKNPLLHSLEVIWVLREELCTLPHGDGPQALWCLVEQQGKIFLNFKTSITFLGSVSLTSYDSVRIFGEEGVWYTVRGIIHYFKSYYYSLLLRINLVSLVDSSVKWGVKTHQTMLWK